MKLTITRVELLRPDIFQQVTKIWLSHLFDICVFKLNTNVLLCILGIWSWHKLCSCFFDYIRNNFSIFFLYLDWYSRCLHKIVRVQGLEAEGIIIVSMGPTNLCRAVMPDSRYWACSKYEGKSIRFVIKDVRANCFCASYCARKFTRHVMHERAR